jgi:hypothetical protein
LDQLSVIYACRNRWFQKLSVCMWFWCLLEIQVRCEWHVWVRIRLKFAIACSHNHTCVSISLSLIFVCVCVCMRSRKMESPSLHIHIVCLIFISQHIHADKHTYSWCIHTNFRQEPDMSPTEQWRQMILFNQIRQTAFE